MIGVVNATRLDYDRKLNWSELGDNVSIYYDQVGSDPTDEMIVERAIGKEILITKEIAISSSLLTRLPTSVRVICEAGTGFNNIALDICKERGITVMNVPSYSSSAVASLVLTFILNFSCSLIPQQRSLYGGDTINFTTCLSFPHFEVAGKTLGLIGGRGNIGSQVAALAKAFGMTILISTRDPISSDSSESGVSYTTSIDELLQQSDFISLHCPLNSETKHLINERTLSLMKSTAYIINTARGGLIDESALAAALSVGAIAGAALDVQDPEPPIAGSPLYSLPNVILTPHIGWKRLETRQRLIDAVAANIACFRNGRPTNIVN